MTTKQGLCSISPVHGDGIAVQPGLVQWPPLGPVPTQRAQACQTHTARLGPVHGAAGPPLRAAPEPGECTQAAARGRPSTVSWLPALCGCRQWGSWQPGIPPSEQALGSEGDRMAQEWHRSDRQDDTGVTDRMAQEWHLTRTTGRGPWVRPQQTCCHATASPVPHSADHMLRSAPPRWVSSRAPIHQPRSISTRAHTTPGHCWHPGLLADTLVPTSLAPGTPGARIPRVLHACLPGQL